MKASGVAGFFGLFAGLCAIFAGCVTLSDWYSEITQTRRWVVATAPDHLHADIILFAIAVVTCVVSLELAKRLKAREAVRAEPDSDGSQNKLVGLLFAAMGLFLTGSVIYRAIHTDAITLDSLMGVPASLMFVFAGILLGLPAEYTKWRAVLATLVISLFCADFRLGCLHPWRTKVQRQLPWDRLHTQRVFWPGHVRCLRYHSGHLRRRDVDQAISRASRRPLYPRRIVPRSGRRCDGFLRRLAVQIRPGAASLKPFQKAPARGKRRGQLGAVSLGIDTA